MRVPEHEMVGSVWSSTVTVATQEPVAPLLSVTVSVTLCVPLPNGPDGLSARLTMVPSGSNEPASMSVGETLASQSVSALTVMLLHKAVGGWSGLPNHTFVAVQVVASPLYIAM